MKFNVSRGVDVLVQGLFVFVGFYVALKAESFLSGMSTFMKEKWVDAILWIVLGWIIVAFSKNDYVNDIGTGFFVTAFYDLVSMFTTV